jgi:simple sugar transport system permease protein
LIALVLCGGLCGLAGAQLSIANVHLFVENMSAGRGWIAVVAVLLTRGRPWPLFFTTLLFGTVDSLSFRMQGLGMPQQFTDMLPYLTTLVVLTMLSWRHRKRLA